MSWQPVDAHILQPRPLFLFCFLSFISVNVCVDTCSRAGAAAGQEVVIPESDKMGSVPTQWTQTRRSVYTLRHTHTTCMMYILRLSGPIMEMSSCSDVYCPSARLLTSLFLAFCFFGFTAEVGSHTIAHTTHTQTLSRAPIYEVICSKV